MGKLGPWGNCSEESRALGINGHMEDQETRLGTHEMGQR